MTYMPEAVASVLAERQRQEDICARKQAQGVDFKTCADPTLDNGTKLAVLVEEVGEVAKELCEASANGRAPSPNLRTELVQVAAVAVAWVEALEGIE